MNQRAEKEVNMFFDLHLSFLLFILLTWTTLDIASTPPPSQFRRRSNLETFKELAVVSTINGELHALLPQSGELLWSQDQVGGPLTMVKTVNADNKLSFILEPAGDGFIYKYSQSQGFQVILSSHVLLTLVVVTFYL